MSGLRMNVTAAASALLIGTAAAFGAATPAAAASVPASGGLRGANNWSCKPTAEHPRPVVLVHGTWSDMATTWSALAPQLQEQGYCVYALDYGQDGSLLGGNLLDMAGGANIGWSAKQLASFVDRVLTETGATQVDIVGHSQGGVVARQYLRFDGGADNADPARNKVHTLVTLGATNHGSTFGDVLSLSELAERLGLPINSVLNEAVGPSYVEQMVGSQFLEKLNAGGDTDPGIDYTVIATRDDRVSTPPSNTFLTAGPGATVNNEWVQTGCPSNTTTHEQLTSDPRAVYLIQVALNPEYADTNIAPC